MVGTLVFLFTMIASEVAAFGLAIAVEILLSVLVLAGPPILRATRIRRFGARILAFVSPRRSQATSGTASAVDRHAISPEGKSRRRPAWFVWLQTGVISLFVLVVVLAVGVQVLWFKPAVQTIMDRTTSKHGVDCHFDDVIGSFVAGRLTFSNLSFSRGADHPTSFDVRMGELGVDLNVWQLLLGRVVFENVHVTSLDARIEKRQGAPTDRVRRHTAFVIDHLVVDDATVAIRTVSPGARIPDLKVHADRFVVEDLQRRWALLDLLSPTYAKGTINGQDFAVDTIRYAEYTQHDWEVFELPVNVVSAFLGPPLTWLSAGGITLKLSIDRSTTDRAIKKIRCRCQLSDYVPASGTGMDVTSGLASKAVQSWLAKQTRPIQIAFDADIPTSSFDRNYSLESAGVLRAIGSGLQQTLQREAMEHGLDVEDQIPIDLTRARKGLERLRGG